MSTTPPRARRLESAVSIFLLAVLGLIGTAIFLRQLPAPAPNQKTADLTTLAPVGFGPLSKTEFYSEANLYEKIDGKAGFYTDSGFEELRTQRFASRRADGPWMEIYIYDMGNINNAFSAYSRQLRPDAQPWKDGQFGYKTGNAMYLVRGRYYVELLCSEQSPSLSELMEQLAENVAALLNADPASIPDLALFPANNLVPLSPRLYLADTFGFEGLNNTFAAGYNIDSHNVTAFFSRRSNHKEAQSLAEKYCKFLIENGAAAKKMTGELGFDARIFDFYGAVEIVFTVGPFVGGVHDAENLKAAEQVASLLIEKLTAAQGVTRQ